MSSAVAIIDPFCLTSCTVTALDGYAAGETETAVLRVARALSGSLRFHFYQNGRTIMDRDRYGLYRPLDAVNGDNVAGVAGIIVINSWKAALRARKLNRDCPIFLWLHRNPGRHNRRMGEALADAGIKIICVSRTHAEGVTAFLQPENRWLPEIGWIYSPVDDDLVADDTPRDPDRLFYPGMPLKGMPEVLAKFEAVRRDRPALRLDIAEPAGLVWPGDRIPSGVNFLGRLPRTAMIGRMRRSLCVFYPQTRCGGPFSQLLAEANAIGTPVLFHKGVGVNDEIAGVSGQAIDSNELDAVGARLDLWRLSPPIVDIPAPFRMQHVALAWKEMLEAPTWKRPSRPCGIVNGLATCPTASPEK
nr:hypothetical protein [Marinicella sp. W31]MDC2879344.1 hypothetical protein [Marinicella sp. W31]